VQAAAKAASRTAEFATTGDWPEEEEEAMYPISPVARSMSPSGSVRHPSPVIILQHASQSWLHSAHVSIS